MDISIPFPRQIISTTSSPISVFPEYKGSALSHIFYIPDCQQVKL